MLLLPTVCFKHIYCQQNTTDDFSPVELLTGTSQQSNDRMKCFLVLSHMNYICFNIHLIQFNDEHVASVRADR